jgi:uncharacterized protein YjbJ (UPF0337 family)
MADTNKTTGKGDELKGKGKEAVGRMTGDREMESEGRTDQVKGNLKQAGEKVKDAAKVGRRK